MNLALMRAEARATSARMQARLEAAIGEDRDLTAEEQAAQDADQLALDKQIARIKSAEALQASAAQIGVDPAGAVQPLATVPAQPKSNRSNDGFRNLGEFANAVRLASPGAGAQFTIDERLAAPTNVHTETGDSASSYLVPAEFREEIVDLVFGEDDPFMDFIAPEPTSRNRVVGLGDESTPWGSSGVQAAWRAEGDQMTASKAALTPRETILHELYAFVLATEELLEDAPRLSNLLTRKAASAIRWKASDAFMYGNGVGKPLGWMNSAALVTQAKKSGQAADTVVAENIGAAYARMINPMQASWLINPDVLPQIMTLTIGNQPIWQPNFALSPGGILLGRPILFTEHAKTLGDKGDIQFVNPNGYEAFRKQNGVSFADSIHLYFDYNIRAFRWIFRIGGQPVLSEPVSVPNSASTKSHFVTIAERA